MSVDVASARMSAGLFIDGAWVEGAGGSLPNVDPGTGEQVGTVTLASSRQVDDAVRAASNAFGQWSTTAPGVRGVILKAAADILSNRMEEAVATILMETGKTEADARGEIGRAIETFRWNGEQAGRLQGQQFPGLAANSRRQSVPTPLGVAVLITAWNFPAVLASRKLGASLAAGCTVVFKASEFAPATAALIVRILEDAGVPSGVVNLVFGDPETVIAQLLQAEPVKVVSFTGSTAVGKSIAKQAAETLTRSVLELGGHAPVIVCEDADIDAVVAVTAGAKFGSAGQSCVAPSRYFVHVDLYERFVAAMSARAAAFTIGHGTDSAVTLGAVAHQGRLDELARLTRDAVDKGARIATGGSALDRDGYYFEPTVLVDVPPDAEVMSEEPFGPILTVSPFRTTSEAIERANNCPYSFAAYVFTDHAGRQAEIASRLNASNIGINQLAPSLPDVPLGGLGNSGYGYEGGTEGILAFCQLRLLSVTSNREDS